MDVCRSFLLNRLPERPFPARSWTHGESPWLVKEVVGLLRPSLAILLVLLHVSLVLPCRVAISGRYSSNMREDTSRVVLSGIDSNHMVESGLDPCTILGLLRPVVDP